MGAIYRCFRVKIDDKSMWQEGRKEIQKEYRVNVAIRNENKDNIYFQLNLNRRFPLINSN
jgi:hypothetical protein